MTIERDRQCKDPLSLHSGKLTGHAVSRSLWAADTCDCKTACYYVLHEKTRFFPKPETSIFFHLCDFAASMLVKCKRTRVLCASAKNVIIPTSPTHPPQQLRSMSHVCKCKERHQFLSSVPHRRLRNRCDFSCHMRLGFIWTVNLFVTPANPARFLLFSRVKCAWLHFDPKFICHSRQPRPWVFSCKMRFGFDVASTWL